MEYNMANSGALSVTDIKVVAGNATCPVCGNRVLLLNLNKYYYCPKCHKPISFTIKKKSKAKIKSANTSGIVAGYSDKWTLVFSIFYPVILSIIPLLCLTITHDGRFFINIENAMTSTTTVMLLLYIISILSALWKSLPKILGMLIFFAIVVGIIALCGIPPQASIPIICFVLATIFILARIGFIIQNWRAVLTGIILLLSAFIPYLFVSNQSQVNIDIFITFLVYHVVVANACLIWLYKHSYTPKQAVLFIGTTPLIIAMLVLPFINNFGIDIDAIYDLEADVVPENTAIPEGDFMVESPVAASIQGKGMIPEPPEIIAAPDFGIQADVMSDYYIETEIITNPQQEHIIKLENSEVDYYASQQSPDTCAIANQRMILADQKGIDYSETYLIKYAEKCGYYTQGQGTPLEFTGQILKDAGLEVIKSDSATLEQIDMALQQGYSVSENLDPNEYITPKYDNIGNPIEQADEMGHNIKVVSLNKTIKGRYTSVVIDDPMIGPQLEIPIDNYINARNDFGNTIFAKNVV
jgi:ribosomal protein S27AE